MIGYCGARMADAMAEFPCASVAHEAFAVEELLRVWPERFARTHGALRPVVERVMREFLTCGLAERGFARAWCSSE